MNASSLSLGRSQSGSAIAARAHSRGLNERIALRIGLAFIAYSRHQSERLSHEAVLLRRQNAQLAHRVLDGNFQHNALIAPTLR
ncbi:hypothetical protein [Agromyces humatus]|uniref:ANTAR domain-containing protein n=1 Tax=Agromyces humatus TaxID=279573 RepID=A0ABP4WVS2_9MICO|nr:hypothetical protein [Agromyces humatus]